MKILIVDFWSDGNIGDAIMQCEIIEQSQEVSNDIHIISCFGKNQFQLNAFNESLSYDHTTWHPSYFGTYINLDKYAGKVRLSRFNRLIKTFASLVISNIKINIYKITKWKYLLGGYRYLNDIEFDAIIFNGRNYRDFDNRLKNYINNQPLLIHQKLISILFPNVPKINAGFSAWQLENEVLNSIYELWPRYNCNVARETYTYEFLKDKCNFPNIEKKKDLSFDYLSNKVTKKIGRRKKVAFSLTMVEMLDRYISEVNKSLKHYFESGYDIVLIDQVYLEHEQVEAIISRIEVPFTRISSKKIEVLLSAYSECEYVISTRMHGSIMALSQGCRVASLAYDDGAKWSIIKDELGSYPIFNPKNILASEIIEYLNSVDSTLHAEQFLKIIANTNEKYVEKFLRNINTKP